jgi:hypothetical protein
LDEEQLELIQKSKKIKVKNLSTYERSITIKHKYKKKIGDLFTDYRSTKTPVEQLDKKKEWDDDLKEN